MIPGLIPVEPTLETHDELVSLQEKRVERAEMKAHIARQELADAVDASMRAKAGRLAWIEAHPPPQIEMFGH